MALEEQSPQARDPLGIAEYRFFEFWLKPQVVSRHFLCEVTRPYKVSVTAKSVDCSPRCHAPTIDEAAVPKISHDLILTLIWFR